MLESQLRTSTEYVVADHDDANKSSDNGAGTII